MRLETGDIVLVKVNQYRTWYRRLLGKLIQFVDGVYYHHAGAIVNDKFYEADSKVVASELDHLVGDEIIVFRLKKPLTLPEQAMYEYLADQAIGRTYDYWGALLHQLLYILCLRRIWIGRTGRPAQGHTYCTELAVLMIHEIRGYFSEPWKTSPSKLLQQAPYYYDVVFQGKVLRDHVLKARQANQ